MRPNSAMNTAKLVPLYGGTTVPFGSFAGDGAGSYWRPRSQYEA
jgi:hypothetical protein